MGSPFDPNLGGIGSPTAGSQLANIMADTGSATGGQTIQFGDGSNWTLPQGWNWQNGMAYDQYGQYDPYRTQLPAPAAYQQLQQQMQQPQQAPAPAPIAPPPPPPPNPYLSTDQNSVNYMKPNNGQAPNLGMVPQLATSGTF